MGLSETIGSFGFERIRRALAALPLSFFGTIYFVIGLTAPQEMTPMLLGLALVYLASFFAVTAEVFWGRWVASGLGWSGVLAGTLGMVQEGWNPLLVFYLAMHG